MDNKNIKPKDVFSKPTFWDVKLERFDLELDKKFIIPRVLSRGTENEIWFVLEYYDNQTILNIINNTKGLDPKVINFFNLVL
jgi:hypothetical protein